MKTFKNMAAQGDMVIRKIDAIPADAVSVKPEKGAFVLSHSETGHNHVVMDRPAKTGGRAAQLFIDKTNAFIGYLNVLEPCEIEHLRSHDTHETIRVEPGQYEIRRQREYTPEGFRRAQD